MTPGCGIETEKGGYKEMRYVIFIGGFMERSET